MKAFRNPHENILELRRLEQQQRQTGLLDARQQRDRQHAALARIEARQKQAAQYIPPAAAPDGGRTLLQRDHFGEHQRRLAKAQAVELARADSLVETRLQEVVEARREVRKLELHGDRLRARWNLEAERQERLVQDDTVNTMTATRTEANPGA